MMTEVKPRSVLSRLYRGETRIDFIGSRKRWYLASGILILICVVSFVFRGFNYGVEFKGGSTFQFSVVRHARGHDGQPRRPPSSMPASLPPKRRRLSVRAPTSRSS